MNGLGIAALVLTGLAGHALLTRSRCLPDAHPALRLAIGASLMWAMLSLFVTLSAGSLGRSVPSSVIAILLIGSWASVNNWRQRRNASTQHTLLDKLSGQSAGFWLALILLSAHLVLILTENLARPTTPWDAWTTWVYRGKAWFFEQALTPTLPSLEWLQKPTASIAVDAYQYPPMVSVLSAVIATFDGGWIETSITLQGTLLALVLCAAVYGSARTLGLQSTAALLTTVGMLSLPLVMSHLSLAGYADLWQALFSSTAMSLLMISRLPERRQTRWLLAAIALASAGIWIKNEGAVWWLLTILIALLVGQRTRLSALLLIALGLMMLSVLIWLAPISFSLPGIGTLGLRDNLLQLGALGEVRIAISPVFRAYLDQLIAHHSFSILTPLLMLGLFTLWFTRHPLATPATWIVLLPLGTQLAIFGLTDYGTFALSGTASSRLLLHFVPVWCLITAVGLEALLKQSVNNSELGGKGQPAPLTRRAPGVSAMVGFSVALLLVGLISIGWLGAQSPQRLQFSVDDMQVMGGSQRRAAGGGVAFDSIQGPVGVMRTPLANADGSTLPLVITDTETLTPQGLAFFWRTSNGQLHSHPLTETELPLLNLAGLRAWTDHPLVETGLLQQPGVAVYPAIQSLTLTDRLSLTDWQTALKLWLRPVPVNLRAVNAVASPDVPGLPSINTLLCLSTLMLIALYVGSAVLSQWRPHPRLIIAGITTLGVIAVVHNAQRQITGLQALDTPAAQLLQGATLTPIAKQLKAMADEPVLITYFDAEQEFAARRLAYELLPLHAGVVSPGNIPADWLGAIVVMAAADERRAALARQLAGDFRAIRREGQYLLLVPQRG